MPETPFSEMCRCYADFFKAWKTVSELDSDITGNRKMLDYHDLANDRRSHQDRRKEADDYE